MARLFVTICLWIYLSGKINCGSVEREEGEEEEAYYQRRFREYCQIRDNNIREHHRIRLLMDNFDNDTYDVSAELPMCYSEIETPLEDPEVSDLSDNEECLKQVL